MSFDNFKGAILFRPAQEPEPAPAPPATTGLKSFTLIRACCVAGEPRVEGEQVLIDYATFLSLKAAQRLEIGASW